MTFGTTLIQQGVKNTFSVHSEFQIHRIRPLHTPHPQLSHTQLETAFNSETITQIYK